MLKKIFSLFRKSSKLTNVKSDLDPKSALQRLLDGNRRYVNNKSIHPNRCKERRQAVFMQQFPYAIIVGCSDSRASPEIIFDEGLGDLFVVRVAGNVMGPIELESIEYAAMNLHSTIILILAHENCGAIEAVINNQIENLKTIAKMIEPSVSNAKDLESKNLHKTATVTNAQNTKSAVENSPNIKQLISEKKIEVHVAYYHFKAGNIELLW